MMLCPWCNQEMKQGFLQSSRSIIFSPEIAEGVVMALREGEVKLTKHFWSTPRAPAWHCAGCKRVVAEYGPEE